MPSTLLSVIQDFQRLKGLEVATAVVASSDASLQQLLMIYTKVGRHIRDKRSWQQLKRRRTFTSLGTEDQGTLTSVLGEANADGLSFEAAWDETADWPLIGEITDQSYQEQKTQLPSAIFYEFHVRGDHMFILGNIPAGHILSFIFKSSNWLETGAGTGVYVDRPTLDTNVSVFSDELMTLGLEAFFRKEKGLEFATHLADFELRIMGKSPTAPRRISMHGGDL